MKTDKSRHSIFLLVVMLITLIPIRAQLNSKRFSFAYWMFGCYGGFNSLESHEFGINFPIINKNAMMRWKDAQTELMTNQLIPVSSGEKSERYWIPCPTPKRLSLQLGLERLWLGYTYRPEIGLIGTPFAFFGNIPDNGKTVAQKRKRLLLNHLVASVEFQPAIKQVEPVYKIGGGIFLKQVKPFSLVVRNWGIRYYFIYHYVISPSSRSSVFTVQVQLNKEPLLRKFNPASFGYRYPYF